MKVMVCGSIGYGGVENIRDFYKKLSEQGFEILNHIEAKGMDYSDIQDFRDKKNLVKEIVEHDLGYLDKADVVVVLSNTPSYGTAIEMYSAKKSGKKVIFLLSEKIPTPWPLYFSDYVVKDEEELYKVLSDLKTST